MTRSVPAGIRGADKRGPEFHRHRLHHEFLPQEAMTPAAAEIGDTEARMVPELSLALGIENTC